MGTEINLTLGGISLAYSKNSMGIDFGHLFQDCDVTRRKMAEINYEYYAENPGEIGDLEQREAAFASPLGKILSRLELLNHTLESARAEYEAIIAENVEIASYSEPPGKTSYLSFDEFCALACRYPLATLNDTYVEYGTPEWQTIAQGRLAADLKEFSRLPSDLYNDDNYYSEKSYVSARLCILSPESMLRVFAINRDNHDVEVVWEFGPLVSNGWANRKDFQPGARRNQKILVATEGVSDAGILKRGLEVLRPDVMDFFYFVDGNERHHFWGTGNLVKFGEGLLRIDIQNKVLFLLDNDAEGVDAHRKLQQLGMPSNMRAMLLPDLDDLRKFPARGPDGIKDSDINGRAAAIECYLDLNVPNHPPAQVTWSNFKKEVDAWHGALEYKELYQKHFSKQDDECLRNGHYDVSKLLKLLNAMIVEASLLTPVGH